MNRVEIVGRLTSDCELKKTGTGKNVCSFFVAVNRRKKDDGADFIPCEAWEGTAEVLHRYGKRGTLIGVSGRLNTWSYEVSGQKQYKWDVVVETLDILEWKNDQKTEEPKNNNMSGFDTGSFVVDPNEDLPF